MTQKTTMVSCEIAMITQSIVNNLTPILFVIFKDTFGISYTLIAHLMLINFSVQLLTDILSIKILTALDYRKSGILAQISAILGLLFLSFLHRVIPMYPALLISTVFMAFGGGLLEVMLSPIIDSLDLGHGSSRMSLLHSFYSWGQVVVVLFSSLAIKLFSEKIWWILPLFWLIVPLVSGILFCIVPIPDIAKEEKKNEYKPKLKSKVFLSMCFLMVCSGASEITMAEWASVFAQKGLGVNKFLGDILGPCFFALLMAFGRLLYGIFGNKLNLKRSLTFASLLCVLCYLTAAISQNQYIALLACSITGFSVSLMWPGVYSYSSKQIKNGGTAMFGILALFGDVGCSLGSWLAGMVSDFSVKLPLVTNYADKIGITYEQIGLKLGIGFSSIFPIMMFIMLILRSKEN